MLNKKYAAKALIRYHDELMSCDCYKLASLLKQLSKDTTSATLIGEATKVLSETTITRKPIEVVREQHKVMFPIRQYDMFGSYSNAFVVSQVGFVTTNTLPYLTSKDAKSKLNTLMTKTSYERFLDAVNNNNLRVTLDGKSESHTYDNVLRHTLLANANYLLQAFIVNDKISICAKSSSSPCLKSDDLVALVDVLHRMITSGVNSSDVKLVIDRIRLHNVNNPLGKVVESIESRGSFEGGFEDTDYLYDEFTAFCELSGVSAAYLSDEKYARAAALYKHLIHEHVAESTALTLTLHFLLGLADGKYDTVTSFIKFHDKYKTVLPRLTADSRGRFTSVGTSSRRPKSASKVTVGAPGVGHIGGNLFKRTGVYLPFNGSLGPLGGDGAGGGGNFWNHCGSTINSSDITARAKNAVKYATLIYKSLFKLYTSVSEKPKYLDPAPYISDVYEIVGKEKNIAPTSIAVDLIPTIINTYVKAGGEDGNIPTNDIGTSAFLNRIPLGLHCNNLRDINNLFNGTNSLMLENVIMFFLEDKLHSITIDDFPYLKSIIDKTTLSEIARPNLSINSISDYIVSFGKLTKYLYELEFKSSFANAFPAFNSLASPKYLCYVKPHTLQTVESFDFRHINWSKSTKSCVAILTDVDKGLVGNNVFTDLVLEVNTEKYTISGNPTTADSLLGSNALPNNDSLISMLELNTNTKEMMKYLTRDGKLKKIYELGNRGTDAIKLAMDNIVDVGIMPININSMMREIPLASLINGVYSFDKIIDWLIHNDVSGNYKPGGAPVRQVVRPATGPNEVMPSTTANEQYINILTQMYKTPLDRYQVPYTGEYLADDMHGHLPKNDSAHVHPRPKVMESGTRVNTVRSRPGSVYNPSNGEYGVGVFEDPRFIFANKKRVLVHENKLYEYFTKERAIGDDGYILYNVCKSFQCIDPTSQTIHNVSHFCVDHDLSNPAVPGKYKSGLLDKLSPLLVFADAPNDTVADASGSYYENQCMYPIMRKDLHHGIDPNLRTPILAANIYSDLLLNLYNEEFKRRFAQTQTISRNQNTIIKGVSALYQRQ